MSVEIQSNKLGYTWWKVYSFLFVTLASLALIPFWMGFFNVLEYGVSVGFIIVVIINIALMLKWLVSMLSMNKYAFLLATILSLIPIFWIINGFYLKTRWHDVEK